MLTYGSMTAIDTNVILRAVLHDHAAQSPVAEQALSQFTRDNPGFITAVTLAEVYWVLARQKRFTKRDCLRVINGLLASDNLEFDDDEGALLALHLAEEGADFADALIHQTAEQFGAHTTVTFDRKAADTLGWTLLES
ncbi:PIN domain-containing protein [Microbacterium sp.]|uniref:PIN domain-containing protein n=1 Tax=Microbacterium sp. TaxID=51671 RepID=UPI003F94DACF